MLPLKKCENENNCECDSYAVVCRRERRKSIPNVDELLGSDEMRKSVLSQTTLSTLGDFALFLIADSLYSYVSIAKVVMQFQQMSHLFHEKKNSFNRKLK